MFYNQINDLLVEWTDKMVSLQLPESYGAELGGGLLCPACGYVHGRCADAVYPLLSTAKRTGNSSLVDAVIRLEKWHDNMNCPDGSWVNDSFCDWKGITVFGTIALGESLRLYSDLLPDAVVWRWKERLRRAADFLSGFDLNQSNINYPLTSSAAFAVVWKVLGDEKYLRRAEQAAHSGVAFFCENGLIFGESKPKEFISPRGCRPVDLGYNVEESLPGLLHYAHLTGDQAIHDLAKKSFRTHLEFMLPDGAWDNSWGVRSYKWTYWGSRTSDGCLPACLMLAGDDLVFAAAAVRNLQLIKNCTHGGLLHGGPHLHLHDEPACLHHTFCHAKALAAALDYMDESGTKDIPNAELPSDKVRPLVYFPELDVYLVSQGDWRMTVCGNDFSEDQVKQPAGGAVSLLYHLARGPVFASSTNEYRRHEVVNMQRHRDGRAALMTPRLEYMEDGEVFMSCADKSVVITAVENGKEDIFQVTGELVSPKGKKPQGAPCPFGFTYRLSEGEFQIVAENKSNRTLALVLPVISPKTEEFSATANSVEIDGVMKVEISGGVFQSLASERIFNQVPGTQALEIIAEVPAAISVTVTLSV